MAEIVVNLQSENLDTKRLAKYECSKLNLSQDVTIGLIEFEIALFQNQMDSKIEKYENLVINLETLIKMISGRHNYIDKKENTKSI